MITFTYSFVWKKTGNLSNTVSQGHNLPVFAHVQSRQQVQKGNSSRILCYYVAFCHLYIRFVAVIQ